MFKLSKKLKSLPPYLFVEIDKAKRKAKAEGRDIIDLGIGDPDQPTPQHIIKALYQAAQDPAHHRYALDQGMPALRRAIIGWYKRRFNVHLDPDTEILPLIGSKEGIAHFPIAFLNEGNCSLVPDPCYPPYKGGTILAGGKPYLMPLLQVNAFLPDLKKIPLNIRRKAKLMFINYPNNPTSAVATRSFYTELIRIAREKNIIIVSDMAYSEVYYDGEKPPSILEIDGAKDVAIEFHSLSKTYYMTGWRIGWACGNATLIAALAKVKSNFDSGIFQAIQVAGIAALRSPDQITEEMRTIYQERRDLVINGLRAIGWKIPTPKATFYLWAKLPKGFTNSMETAKTFLDKANIVVTPGNGFGENGEGYIRMTLTVSKDRLAEAVNRIGKIL